MCFQILQTVEKNYHPLEVEMLAIVWGCEKMKMFLLGLPTFQIQTDHKPLIPILQSKMLTEMSPRIQNMRFKLLNYSFTVEYCPGKEMIDADALSRAPTEVPTDQDLIAENDMQCHINAVIQQLPATDSRLEEIREKTASDPVLTELVTVIMHGWPDDRKGCSDTIKPY